MVGLTPVSDSWDVGGEEKTVYGQVEEATVTSLRPATLYHIRLFAENELGRSKEGRVLQVGSVYYSRYLVPFYWFPIFRLYSMYLKGRNYKTG